MEFSHRHWEKSSKGHVWCGSNIIYAYERLTLITAEYCRADPKDPSPPHCSQRCAPACLLSLLTSRPLCKILIILTKSLPHSCEKINQSYPM